MDRWRVETWRKHALRRVKDRAKGRVPGWPLTRQDAASYIRSINEHAERLVASAGQEKAGAGR